MRTAVIAKELRAIAEELMNGADTWITEEQMREICPACANKMASQNIKRVRASVIMGALFRKADMTWEECIEEAKKKKNVKDPEKLCGWLRWHGPNASVASDKKAQWEKLPHGWTEESLKSFWNSLVGSVKHKVTKCIDKMKGCLLYTSPSPRDS